MVYDAWFKIPNEREGALYMFLSEKHSVRGSKTKGDCWWRFFI